MVSVNIRPPGLCSALPHKHIYLGPGEQHPTFHSHWQSPASSGPRRAERQPIKGLAANPPHFINSTVKAPGTARTGRAWVPGPAFLEIGPYSPHNPGPQKESPRAVYRRRYKKMPQKADP